MYEAIIRYSDWLHVHRIEAGSIEKLKEKCEPYAKSKSVYCIEVNKLEHVGYIKADGIVEVELI